MIHRLAGRLFHLIVLLLQHLCLAVDPSKEFILNWCSSLCWHLLLLILLFASLLQLCYVWKVTLSFCRRQKASNIKHDNGRASLRNNTQNIKATLKSFPHTFLMFLRSFHARITKTLEENIMLNLSSSFVIKRKISSGAKASKDPYTMSKICWGK